MATRELSDIIESVVSGLDRTVTITGVTVSGDSTIIQACDAKYTEPGRTITIDGNTYTVTAVDHDLNTITVTTTADPITADSFVLYEVFYFHGTQYDTENQIKDIPNADSKTPMVFLLIPYTESFSEEAGSSIERDSRFSLFFLTQANFDNWPTVVAMNLAIRPMNALKDLFIQQMKELPGTFKYDTLQHTRTPRPRFGVYISNKGTERAWQAMDLSGIQEDFSGVSIYKPEPGCPC